MIIYSKMHPKDLILPVIGLNLVPVELGCPSKKWLAFEMAKINENLIITRGTLSLNISDFWP